MKKKIILALSGAVIISAVAFTGYKLLHKDESISPDAVPVEQALDELKDYKFGEYENVRFDCNVSEVQKVYERLDAQTLKDSNKDLDTLRDEGAQLLKILADFDIDKQKLIESEGQTYETMLHPDKAYNVEYLVDNEWTFVNSYNSSFEMRDMRGEAEPLGEEGAVIVKRLRPGEITDDLSYNVGGEDYKLSDAIAFTDSKLDKLKDKYLFGNEPVLCAAAVIHSPEADQYSYMLKYYNTYDGVRFDNNSHATPDWDYPAGGYIVVEIRHKDKFYIIHNLSTGNIKDKKEATRIIPLSQAEKLAAEVLAARFDATITECELKYVCITHYDTEEKSYTPMWVFTIEDLGEAMRGGADNYKYAEDPFEKNTFYVDALTGDYYLYKCSEGCIYKNGDDGHVLGQDREHEKNYEDF